MKLCISPDGFVAVETDDAVQAAALIKALSNGARVNGSAASPARPVSAPPSKEAQPPVSLSPALLATWEWLTSFETSESGVGGITGEDAAGALGINPAAALFRLRRLVSLGLAYQPGRGLFKPVEA
jgi:hypothetical protein